MIVLALDTAGVDCSVAVYDGASNHVLASVTERIGKGHSERLMAMLDETLAQAGIALSQVERIGVTVGPGSFTGIRTGVATARGLSLALGVPAAGISALAVLAAGFREDNPGKPVVTAIDAKRGEIYAQAFDGAGVALGAPQALDVAGVRELAERCGAVVTGSAAPLVAGLELAGEADHFSAGLAARLVHALDILEKPKPLYLRAPDAKPQSGFAISRI
nr:tRNA (adenosine(37)-N6)-threonylcarbamoyltransferase complex dimerization subunit type 1 TsaB [uncultured Gellertiella sp.]